VSAGASTTVHSVNPDLKKQTDRSQERIWCILAFKCEIWWK